jgi:nicotinamidase-related amidase
MLIVIDMLADFLDRWPQAERARLVAAVEQLTSSFAAAGKPIAWVRQEFEGDLSDAFLEMRRKSMRITIKGTPGCRIVPELTRRPGDQEIVKKRYSAFFGTDLDRLVARHRIDTVVLAGINTHACIRTTAIDAYQRDLAVVLAREAVGSYDTDHAAISLKYMDGKIADVMPVEEVVARIGAA